MANMLMKTIVLTTDDNPVTWDESKYQTVAGVNTVVGYLLSPRSNKMTLNLYLLPPSTFYTGSLDTIKLNLSDLKSAFLQWLDLLSTAPNSFQFRNPPLDLWLETRLNWINALCVKIHNKFGTDTGEALSTAYMTILAMHQKGSVYIGNLHYLEIAIVNAVKKEHHYMRNRLTGAHPDAIHLDASPGEFGKSIDNDVTSFHEIISLPTWDTEEEQRYDEIWQKMKVDLAKEFSEREIDQICKGTVYMSTALYRRLLKWRKAHDYYNYL